jgi:nucleoside-diphosphate-sugar epimerase
VTGGTGYLGSAICRALIARGHDVTPFARANGGDVRDRAALLAASRGMDAIIHTAALVTVWRRRRQDFDDINVGGLENVLAVANELSLSRIVYTSSFLALPPAGASSPVKGNDYQRTKALALDVARRAADKGAPITMMAPGVIYGPGLMSEGNLVGRMVADHLAGKLPGLIGPDRIWSFSWVDDVASAHADALETGQPGQLIEAGGHNLEQRAPFQWLLEHSGKPLPRTLPVWAGTLAGAYELVKAQITGRAPLLTPATVEIFKNDWPMRGRPSLTFDQAMTQITASQQPMADPSITHSQLTR